MNREDQLFLDICSFAAPDRARISDGLSSCTAYDRLLGRLLWHRMGGAAYGTLRETGLLGAVDREFRSALETAYRAACIKNESFSQALCALGSLFQNMRAPCAALKGAYLTQAYPVGYRTSNDVDFLLRPEDVSEAADLLEADGFRQGSVKNGEFVAASRAEIIYSRMNRGETVPFVKRIGLPFLEFLEVDLNFSLDYKPEDSSRTGALLAERAPLPSGLETLAPPAFFVHLCTHLYKEATTYAWVEMRRDLSLYKFADLYFLLQAYTDADYLALKRTVRRLGAERECAYAVIGTKRLFGLDGPALNVFVSETFGEWYDCLDEVTDPARGKRYLYDLDFCARFFRNDRIKLLKEVGGFGKTAYV